MLTWQWELAVLTTLLCREVDRATDRHNISFPRVLDKWLHTLRLRVVEIEGLRDKDSGDVVLVEVDISDVEFLLMIIGIYRCVVNIEIINIQLVPRNLHKNILF